MPVDDLAHGAASLNNSDSNHTQNDLSNEYQAEIRLQHEAEEQQRRRRALPARAMWDITEDFVTATRQLRPGELIKDEYFTLFEAVGALEIMDPKMDSGCVPSGDTFEPQFNPRDELSPSQILWIMDEIFRLEMSFHDGYPLSQNLFTSLHIFDLIDPNNDLAWIPSIDDSKKNHDSPNLCLLWAYCVATIKCVQPVLYTIQGQMYFEEEDFVTHLFGRELLPGVSHHDARKLLVEAMDLLDNSRIDPTLKHAIKYRLVCREYILFCMDKSHECWEKLRSKLVATLDGENVLTSHRDLATPVPDAFSNKVTRQLATSTPPRPMPVLSWKEALTKWVQMCNDILAAYKLTERPMRYVPHALQRATWAFAYRTPEPNTFARAKMQDILCTDDCVAGEVSHWELMHNDMQEMHLAGEVSGDQNAFAIELPSDPRYKVARLTEEFMLKAFPEYLNMYRYVCQNRCRLRRLMGQSIRIWAQLGNEAQEVDAAVFKPLKRQPRRAFDDVAKAYRYHLPLWSWAADYAAQTMVWYVQLGFETEVYLPREMSLVYAVLCEILSSQGQNHDFAKFFNDSKIEEYEKIGPQQYVEDCQVAGVYVRFLRTRNIIELAMAQSLVAFYGLLEKLRIIDTDPKVYGKKELQYEARMKSILGGLTDYSNFRLENIWRWKAPVSGSPRTICTTEIPTRIKILRKSLVVLKRFTPEDGKYVGTEKEWEAEIKSLERTCIAIGVEASRLLGICEQFGVADETKEIVDLSDRVEVEIPATKDRYHVWWVVPKVKVKVVKEEG